ncbi:MAG: hypothetical protein IJ672_07405 [Methanobrevibacter sp.]|nr:hypothetical protein [Methanobrevibacter sp.]
MKFKVYTIAAKQDEANKYKWDILYTTPTDEVIDITVDLSPNYSDELVSYTEVMEKLSHIHKFNDPLFWYDCEKDDPVDLRGFVISDDYNEPILELIAV